MTCSKDRNGLSIATGPVLRHEAETTPKVLYHSLLDVLAQSKVIRRPDWKTHRRDLLRQLKYKSFKELETDADYCFVIFHCGIFTFNIWRPNKPGKGYDGPHEKEIVVDAAEGEIAVIGAMNQALSKCRLLR